MSGNNIKTAYILVVLLILGLPSGAHAAGKAVPQDKAERKSFLPPPPKPDYLYDDGQKRDPLIPLVNNDGRYVQLERTPEEETETELKLEGIIYDKYGVSFAIVDGSVVKVGDAISDYQVLQIDEDRVVFIREGQPKEVLLKKED
ncbi:MAG: hypothetical protein MUC52_03010 [Candidatus Omnitrophica bacterium]|jgi:hypothetical protein|nr:hypothetical protein [Candidatus Omnitrophota bacterium]